MRWNIDIILKIVQKHCDTLWYAYLNMQSFSLYVFLYSIVCNPLLMTTFYYLWSHHVLAAQAFPFTFNVLNSVSLGKTKTEGPKRVFFCPRMLKRVLPNKISFTDCLTGYAISSCQVASYQPVGSFLLLLGHSGFALPPNHSIRLQSVCVVQSTNRLCSSKTPSATQCDVKIKFSPQTRRHRWPLQSSQPAAQ